jgi:hypothetical protein
VSPVLVAMNPASMPAAKANIATACATGARTKPARIGLQAKAGLAGAGKVMVRKRALP